MKILLTAGPTREPIDEVRFLSNRSSGKVGLSLARAAHDAGHRVTLLLGPVCAGDDLPGGIEVVRFGSTADLQRELEHRFDACDALIMAAAVADYRPAEVIQGKTPRAHDPEATMTIQLEPTPDLVASLA
ncbi:MAG: phosphopantothenoylcysteine decarboxylase, partial [Phycisphaeraceae bacterium]